MKKNKSARWLPRTIGTERFELINFDHAAIEKLVLDEMDTGFEVFYDNRWGLTSEFSHWLVENQPLFRDRSILNLGAGAGIETLVLAKYARKIYINDLSELSLQLCAEQLEENGLNNFESLPGDYTRIPVPLECDLAIACFSIYCPVTSASVKSFLNRFRGEVIIVNEFLKPFREFLTEIDRESEVLKEFQSGVALRFPAIPLATV
ncbi:MAG: class I SAM-dependent methyltransferase [Verrucomicrobiales bacterium]|nr:class I SAM-dependent methyltransferase [Verrucomicrobiales bacterium]